MFHIFKILPNEIVRVNSNTHFKVTSLLINVGADVNAKDKNGKTVLDYLPQSSRLMRQLLEEHGAK